MTLSQTELARMRATVQRTALSMTCTIQRRMETGVDAYGHPTYEWANIATGVPCMYWEGQVTQFEAARIQVVFGAARMQMEARTDVQADDRIQDVTAQDDTVIVSNLRVIAVSQRQTVTALEVERVQ